MPKRSTEHQRAWDLKRSAGIGYQEALRRVRAESAATPDSPSGVTAAAVAYVLAPTAAEAAEGITAEELGVRALPEDAGPALRAHAEAVWRPQPDTSRPCRCSGLSCQHGERCDGGCPGRMIHADRHPGSMFDMAVWADTYECDACGDGYEISVTLPDLPWGEVRQRAELAGGERTLSSGLPEETRVLVLYEGIRHPNFPDRIEDDDQDDDVLAGVVL
ncbi:hypothetical protein ACSCBZ_46840 [Streptomyces niveiscabiei]|uniref:hypothetical protein n=1 Tax=Streptomyces niveiscabiei TaxID=164115 RepID=UPI0006EB3C30|nr:hypothetical protein [Streptomyces niveiscabiei]